MDLDQTWASECKTTKGCQHGALFLGGKLAGAGLQGCCCSEVLLGSRPGKPPRVR